MGFITIKNNNSERSEVPADSISMTKSDICIADSLLIRFNPEIIDRTKNVKARYGAIKTFRVGLAVDVEKKQIKLLPNIAESEKFSFKLYRLSSTRWRSNKPMALRRMNMPNGIYHLSNHRELIFTLFEKKED